MLKRLHQLSIRAGVRGPLTGDQLDFGEVVAVLIVLIGLVPFASAGLWTSP